MRRVLCALAALALLTSACGGGEPEPSPSPTTQAAATRAPTPTPTPEPVLAPLTGVPVEDETVLDRPVLALKIDNATAARPQQGLELADVVVEELVEGGGTRFIALYHSIDPGAVGPVRSGRDVDAEILPAFQPVFGISGAAGPTYQVLRGAGLKIYEEGQADGAFFREGSRPRPYNLFATAERLWASADELPPAEEPWPIAERAPLGGDEIEAARFSFSHAARVAWTWDEAAGAWRRAQDGAAHTTADGEQIDARNVVIALVPVVAGGGIDAAGNSTAHIGVIGEGEAIILRDGEAYTARWRKESAEAHFTWLTAAGRALPLAPGNTWIELLPSGAEIDLQTPPPPVGETSGGTPGTGSGRTGTT